MLECSRANLEKSSDSWNRLCSVPQRAVIMSFFNLYNLQIFINSDRDIRKICNFIKYILSGKYHKLLQITKY